MLFLLLVKWRRDVLADGAAAERNLIIVRVTRVERQRATQDAVLAMDVLQDLHLHEFAIAVHIDCAAVNSAARRVLEGVRSAPVVDLLQWIEFRARGSRGALAISLAHEAAHFVDANEDLTAVNEAGKGRAAELDRLARKLCELDFSEEAEIDVVRLADGEAWTFLRCEEGDLRGRVLLRGTEPAVGRCVRVRVRVDGWVPRVHYHRLLLRLLLGRPSLLSWPRWLRPLRGRRRLGPLRSG